MAGPAATAKNKQAEAIDDARAKSLKRFITTATKKDPGAVFTFNGPALAVPVISTGALSLDFALGVGGLPRGRIIEIYGPESVGKTSLALSCGAQAIKAGGMVGYVDVEHAINPDHVRGMGIDMDYFALSQPSSGEEALQMAETMVREGIFDVVVVDSVAALVTQQELNGEIGDATVGSQARLMSSALRRLVGIVGASNTVLIFINQLREKVGVLYGSPETTSGGKALKYYASVRIDIRSPAGMKVMDPKDTKRQIGLGCKAKVVKCKVAPPQKVGEYNLIWGQGIDFAASVFDVAKDLGVLQEMPGYTYVIAATGEPLGRGKDACKAALTANPQMAATIAELCYAQMKATAVPVEPVGDPGPIPDSAFAEEDDDLEQGNHEQDEPLVA